MKKPIILLDSTLLFNSAKFEIGERLLRDDPIINYATYKLDVSKAHFVDYLDVIAKKTRLNFSITREVIGETLYLNQDNESLVNDKLFKNNYPGLKNFRDCIQRGSLGNIKIIESENPDFLQNVAKSTNQLEYKKFYGAKRNSGDRHNSFTKKIRGQSYGDISILTYVDSNPNQDCIVVTSDISLGVELNKRPNVSSMNISGFYTSLRDFDVLKRIGMKDYLPNGNEFEKTLNKFKHGSYIVGSTKVITSDEFEDYLENSKFKVNSRYEDTEVTTFEEVQRFRASNSYSRR